VWQLHEVYSDDSTKQWVQQGCRSAGIGCLECKKPVIDAVNAELAPMRQRALEYEEQPELIFSLLAEGAERAADVAEDTLRDVRSAMGLNYR
jgi:tryptophanyl-tRNA synthetase